MEKIIQKLGNKQWKKRGRWFHSIFFSEIFLDGGNTSTSKKINLPFNKHGSVWFSNGEYYDLNDDWDSIRNTVKKEYKLDKNYLNKYANNCLKE